MSDGARHMAQRRQRQSNWRLWLIDMPRYPKRALLMVNDALLLTVALWAAFSSRLNIVYLPSTPQFTMLWVLAPAIGIVTFYYFGLYKLVTRFISAQGMLRIFVATTTAAAIWAVIYILSGVEAILPRSSLVMYPLFSGVLISASRQVAGWILNGVPNATPARFETHSAKRVLIYGAGPTGVQLQRALQRSGSTRPVAFVDERPNLWGQTVSGIKVHRPVRIGDLILRHQIEEILIAYPEATRQRRKTIIRRLEAFKVGVKTLPAMEDIASGQVKVSDLRPISAEDLLGRDRVQPDPELLRRNIRGKSVLVTGAGGSIGAEIARQVAALGPEQLVLLDVSEPALYEIERELLSVRQSRRSQTLPAGKIVSVLGSVLDDGLVRRTIDHYRIQTIYHAAAYKHVPIVEHNPVVGLRNNTFGTRLVAEAARDLGVERLVLISTDKAVRPTNIMGASKRLAELVLQAMAAEREGKTVFTIVRFGNVLDSSGSVVQLFRKQIEAGGPVTVTHPEIIRYFMSIPEAAELVLQAGAMANGGDVFVLDMGAPVKIDSLARSMIKHMGLKIRSASNPAGDIAIVYLGLRPGEKLYEELLINEETIKTAHPRISRSLEPGRPAEEIERELQALETAMSTADITAIHAVLKRMVEGYVPETRHLAHMEAGAKVPWQTGRRTLH